MLACRSLGQKGHNVDDDDDDDDDDDNNNNNNRPTVLEVKYVDGILMHTGILVRERARERERE